MSATFDNWKLKAGRVAHKIAQNPHVQSEIHSFTNLLHSTTSTQRKVRVPPIGDLERPSNIEARNYIVRYLYQHAFLPKHEPYPDGLGLNRALTRFQRETRIQQTGLYDYDTAKAMETPRCATLSPRETAMMSSDNPSGALSFTDHYTTKWNKTHLFYRFLNISTKLSAEDCFEGVRKGFQMWAHVSMFDFTELSMDDTRPVDIEIGFYNKTQPHSGNCMDAFDGVGKVAAHAIYPRADGSTIFIHFDDDEPWTIDFLRTVAAHEVGHNLGLEHSLNPNAAMFWAPSATELIADDVRGIQSKYGARVDAWEPIQLQAHVGDKSHIAAVSHDRSDIDLFYTDPRGAVMSLGIGGALGVGVGYRPTWSTNEISPPGTSMGKAIAAVSNSEDNMDVVWIDQQGGIRGMNWNVKKGKTTYVVAPPGSAHEDTNIAAISRHWTVTDIFWITMGGAVVRATRGWDNPADQWTVTPVADATWATPGGIAAISRDQDVIEIYFVGPDGDVKEFSWRDSQPQWQYQQVAPRGTARIGFTSSITAVSTNHGHVEVFFFRDNEEGVKGAIREQGMGWRIWEPPVRYDLTTLISLAVFSRREQHAELWWVSILGAVTAIYKIDPMPGDMAKEGTTDWILERYSNDYTVGYFSRLTPLVRRQDVVDVFARGPSGNIVQFALRD